MNLTKIFLGFIFLTNACNEQKKLKFQQIFPYPGSDKPVINVQNKQDKIDYFIVSGYADNNYSDSVIRSFTDTHKDTAWKSYQFYEMVFYKKSENTNEKSIKDNPRIFVRYSQDHDWIFQYIWNEGKFDYKNKVRDGQFVDPPNNIKIEDTKP